MAAETPFFVDIYSFQAKFILSSLQFRFEVVYPAVLKLFARVGDSEYLEFLFGEPDAAQHEAVSSESFD